MKFSSLLVFLFLSIISFSQNSKISITYVGNMGVLISGSEHSVLIDGLHKEYGPAYQFPPDELVEKITKNKKIKPPITFVMNTHIHGDHFHNQLVADFLKSNKSSFFVGPQQAVDEVAQLKASTKQLKGVPTQKHGRYEVKNPHLNITGFYLNHANPRMHNKIKNVGFLIEMDGIKLVHFGDAFWMEEVIENLELKKEGIDIAILPAWMIASQKNKKLIEKYLAPKKVIATHISPTYPQTLDALKEAFPEAISFTKIMQEFDYNK